MHKNTMIEYRFKLDENYIVESIMRWRKQHITRGMFIAIKAIASFLLIAFAILFFCFNHYILGVVFIALVFFMYKGHLVDLWLAKRRLRKSPYFNDNVVITISPESYHEKSDKSESTIAWSAFTKVRRFNDGVLLFQGALVHWLPNSAIASGSVSLVEELARDNIGDYKIIEHGA